MTSVQRPILLAGLAFLLALGFGVRSTGAEWGSGPVAESCRDALWTADGGIPAVLLNDHRMGQFCEDADGRRDAVLAACAAAFVLAVFPRKVSGVGQLLVRLAAAAVGAWLLAAGAVDGPVLAPLISAIAMVLRALPGPASPREQDLALALA